MHKLKYSLAIGLAAAFLSSAAMADQPGSDWISKDTAIQEVAKQGYANTYLKADDGHWEGEATKGGRIYEIHVDPHTGAITKS